MVPGLSELVKMRLVITWGRGGSSGRGKLAAKFPWWAVGFWACVFLLVAVAACLLMWRRRRAAAWGEIIAKRRRQK